MNRDKPSQPPRFQLSNTLLCDCQVVQSGVGPTITRRQSSDAAPMDVEGKGEFGVSNGIVQPCCLCWTVEALEPSCKLT